jgi:hypothetical protein
MSFAVGEGVVESVGVWECGSVGVWECGSVAKVVSLLFLV